MELNINSKRIFKCLNRNSYLSYSVISGFHIDLMGKVRSPVPLKFEEFQTRLQSFHAFKNYNIETYIIVRNIANNNKENTNVL